MTISSWLAGELGGRVVKTDLRTGPFLRRTAKIIARQHGISWECYVNAASTWLWLNGSGTSGAELSINRRAPVMMMIEPVADAFERLKHPVFTRPGSSGAREQCRAWETFVEQLALKRFDYVIATPDQFTLWNRRPRVETLRDRIAVLRTQFGDDR